MPRPRMDHQHLAPVFSGMTFPARTWQLKAQADYYGANYYTRAALAGLPEGSYHDLAALLTALNATPTVTTPTVTRPTPVAATGRHDRQFR